jgi:hypothetical protein
MRQSFIFFIHVNLRSPGSGIFSCDSVSLGEQFPTFQRNMMTSLSRVKESIFFNFWTVEDEGTTFPQNVRNH